MNGMGLSDSQNPRPTEPSALTKPKAHASGDFDDIRSVTRVDEMEEVYRLTHDSYVSKSYAENQPNGLLLHYPEFDVIPETTVLGTWHNEKMIGTVSLTISGPFGFTLDRDFREDIEKIKNEGRTVAVIWRLVVREDNRSSRAVLIGLISSITRLALNLGVNTCFFEVNPKHERVYQRLLNMTTVSRKDGADGLQHAPAVLLRADLESLPAEWRLGDYSPEVLDPMGLAMLDQMLNPLPNMEEAS